MATIIEQAPLSSSDYNRTPVGQNVMFAVSNNIIVATQIKVKFVAEVHISSYLPPVPGTTDHLVGTFKTTPNNAGIGMFDLRPIIESYVKSDNLTKGIYAEYKGVPASKSSYPLHLVDKFSGSNNIMRYLFVNFKVEFLDQEQYLPGGVTPNPTYNQLIQVQPEPSESYKIFNGYLKYTDKLDQIGVDYGYNTSPLTLATASSSFLTNASVTQYANITDYGTLAFMNISTTLKVLFTYYDSDGGSLGSDSVIREVANGAPQVWNADIGYEVLHFGCFPANLRNWSSTFQGIVATISYYTVEVRSLSPIASLSKTYTINVNCPTLKGYEPIRLTWLNQWGAWDYYTFTMKSSRMISTQGSTYNQLAGTWNESSYRIDSFKGGKKAFRVNATEKITMNTDFVNEAESEWFEDLINSPEVYILDGFQTDQSNAALNQYVTPVRLTTSSYTRKTVANDKLMQYTFEVEKSKTLRTQSV